MQVTCPAIWADRLSVTIGGDHILHEVALGVGAGEAVALLGANGPGKSTLLRAILGLLPSHGTIRLFGTELAKFGQCSRVAYVPQHASSGLLNVTVSEAVSTGLLSSMRPFRPLSAHHRSAIRTAIDQVGLSGRENQVVAQLSGGQRRRTLIASALVAGPQLLIMDEPLAGVDLETQHALAALLIRLRTPELSLVTVLHETSSFADLIYRVITLDAVAELPARRHIWTCSATHSCNVNSSPHCLLDSLPRSLAPTLCNVSLPC